MCSFTTARHQKKLVQKKAELHSTAGDVNAPARDPLLTTVVAPTVLQDTSAIPSTSAPGLPESLPKHNTRDETCSSPDK